jgi:hypothetical protein
LTTAIIGVGNLESALARHLVGGDEPVVLAAKEDSHPEAVSQEIGPLARAASVEYAIASATSSPIRYIAEAAAGANTPGLSEMRIANVTPYFFDETALRNAVERLDALASPPPRDESRTELVG